MRSSRWHYATYPELLIPLLILFIPAPATASPIRVLAIGDSITGGFVSNPTGPAYVDSLAELLGPAHDVVSIGCGYSTAAVWRPAAAAFPCPGRNMDLPIDYFDDLVDPHTPSEIATIMLGTNDATLASPVQIYLSSLTQIAQGLLERGVGVVVLMTPPPHPSTDPKLQDLLAQYVAGIVDPGTGLCATLDGVLCGPNVFDLLDPVSDFQPFDLHPNAAGHAKIASALFDTIVAIPEPSAALLLAGGLGVLAAQRRSGR